MDVNNLGKIGKVGIDAAKIEEPRQEKQTGKTSDFEKIRTEKLEKEEQVTGLKANEIQYNENVLSRMDTKKVENDFMRQVKFAGDGKELDVLSQHIQDLKNKVADVRTAVPQVDKSEFSESVQNYFQQAETRFKKLDGLVSELSSGDRQYSMQDLLKIQVQMYGVSQNLEILSKVVDKVTEGMKTILRTQV